MWPFKKKVVEVPKLEFTQRSYWAGKGMLYCIILLHVDKVIHGQIKETDYGVWQIELCGQKAERFHYGDALETAREIWKEWYGV